MAVFKYVKSGYVGQGCPVFWVIQVQPEVRHAEGDFSLVSRIWWQPSQRQPWLLQEVLHPRSLQISRWMIPRTPCCGGRLSVIGGGFNEWLRKQVIMDEGSYLHCLLLCTNLTGHRVPRSHIIPRYIQGYFQMNFVHFVAQQSLESANQSPATLYNQTLNTLSCYRDDVIFCSPSMKHIRRVSLVYFPPLLQIFSSTHPNLASSLTISVRPNLSGPRHPCLSNQTTGPCFYPGDRAPFHRVNTLLFKCFSFIHFPSSFSFCQ